MLRLGIHLDAVAALREIAGTSEPDPVATAILAEMGGADLIGVYLRQNRQFVQDRDVNLLKKIVRTRFNLHIVPSEDMIAVVLAINPDIVTLRSEKMSENNIEHGLDVIQEGNILTNALKTLRGNRVICAFIDPDLDQIKAAHKLGINAVSLNARFYAGSYTQEEYMLELERLANAAVLASRLGLQVTIENGIDYQNLQGILTIKDIDGIIVGHAAVARAMLIGMERAVNELARWVKNI